MRTLRGSCTGTGPPTWVSVPSSGCPLDKQGEPAVGLQAIGGGGVVVVVEHYLTTGRHGCRVWLLLWLELWMRMSLDGSLDWQTPWEAPLRGA